MGRAQAAAATINNNPPTRAAADRAGRITRRGRASGGASGRRGRRGTTQRFAGRGDAPATDLAGVLVEAPVGEPVVLVVVEQHELIVHVDHYDNGV